MDAIAQQKAKLDSMLLTENELKMLSECRRNAAVLTGGFTLFGAVGGYFMTKGNGSGRALQSFVIGCTMLAGGCLGLGIGIQNSMAYLSKQPGELGTQVREYQNVISRSRKARERLKVGDSEDREFEAAMARDILPQRSKFI